MESASQLDANHVMTDSTTHIIYEWIHSFASADIIAGTLFHANMDAAFTQDNQFNSALDYEHTRQYNLRTSIAENDRGTLYEFIT